MLGGRHLRVPPLLEFGVAVDVGARGPLPAAAEAGQPFAQIEEERLAPLLAVVADIDAGLGLLRHDRLHGLAASRREVTRVDRLAARAPDEQVGEGFRPRQAAGVGGEDAFGAAPHEETARRVRTWALMRVPRSDRRLGKI